jgi:hypothetical protein
MTTTNVLALQKQNGERFVFLYDDYDVSFDSLQQRLGAMAADEELNFNWFDACVVSQKASDQHQTLRQI